MELQAIQSEMEKLFEEGDMKAAEAYILEHYTDLPEAIQGKVLAHFARQTLDQQAGEEQIKEMRKEGIAALEEIAALRATLRDGDR